MCPLFINEKEKNVVLRKRELENQNLADFGSLAPKIQIFNEL